MEIPAFPPPAAAGTGTDLVDAHDLSLIQVCLSLTPEQRLARLAAAHAFRAVLREVQPFELRER